MTTDSPLTVEECTREIATQYGIRDRWTGELQTSEIKQLIRRTQPQWIDVREKLPRDDEIFLVFCPPNIMGLAWRDCVDGSIRTANEEMKEFLGATHWQPLPEPPRER